MAIRITRWTSSSPWSWVPQDESVSNSGLDLPIPVKSLQDRTAANADQITGLANPTPAATTSSIRFCSENKPEHHSQGFGRTTSGPTTNDAQMPNASANRHQDREDNWIACGEPIAASELALTASAAIWTSTPLLDPGLTFRLHSNPTATRIIYLDFDGHTTTGTLWNNNTMGASFTSPAYDVDSDPASFSTDELSRIQQIWQRVASDFAPFDVDVTTQAPPLDWLSRTFGGDTTYGIRVVVTSYGPSSGTAGGIASVNSFTLGSDTPAFVYNKDTNEIAEACSHEVGHSLGLSHDGTSTSSYFLGQGSGETGWASIMGASYYKNVTTWDNGTYPGSTNGGSNANYGKGPDDLAVITTYNGFSYRLDSEGSSLTTPSLLTVKSGTVRQFGAIQTNTDQDWFSFTLAETGSLELSVDPYWYQAYGDDDSTWGGTYNEYVARCSDTDPNTAWTDHAANLDLNVALYDNRGDLLLNANPDGLAATLTASNLEAGTYFLGLSGSGYYDSTYSTTVYSSYGSIGNYCITGLILSAVDQAGGTSGNPPVDPPQTTLPVLSITNLRLAEGTGTSQTIFQADITISSATTNDVQISYTTVDGSASSIGSTPDYLATGGNIIIPKGQLSGKINISVVADSAIESDETFFIHLSNPVNASLGTNEALVTILNDDIKTSGTKNRGGGKSRVIIASNAVSNFSLNSPDDLTGITLDTTQSRSEYSTDRRGRSLDITNTPSMQTLAQIQSTTNILGCTHSPVYLPERPECGAHTTAGSWISAATSSPSCYNMIENVFTDRQSLIQADSLLAHGGVY